MRLRIYSAQSYWPRRAMASAVVRSTNGPVCVRSKVRDHSASRIHGVFSADVTTFHLNCSVEVDGHQPVAVRQSVVSGALLSRYNVRLIKGSGRARMISSDAQGHTQRLRLASVTNISPSISDNAPHSLQSSNVSTNFRRSFSSSRARIRAFVLASCCSVIALRHLVEPA